MKFFETSDLAAKYLKQAIPLMVKYKITPNPINYAVWYRYIANSNPTLNRALENAIETYGTCPDKIAEELFHQYLFQDAQQNDEEMSQMQDALQSVMVDLDNKAGDVAKLSQDYNVELEKGLMAFEQSISTEPLENIVKNLANSTDAIHNSNKQFQEQIIEAQAEIQRLKVELECSRHDASIDPLTGLFNRRYFDRKLSEYNNATARPTVSLFMLDIDHFKNFNDTHGHLLGDQVLKFVAKLLQQECPSPFHPVRFGGEEFAVLCPGLDATDTAKLADNIRQKLAKVCFTSKKTGKKIEPITASFGVSQQLDNDSSEELIDRADTALYQAKKSGRNQVIVATDT